MSQKLKVPKSMQELNEFVRGNIADKYEYVEAKVVGYNTPHIRSYCQAGVQGYTKERHTNPDHQNYNPSDCVNQWGVRVQRTWTEEGIEEKETRIYSLKGLQLVNHVWKSFDKEERIILIPWTGPDLNESDGTWWAYGSDETDADIEVVEVEVS